MDNNRTYNVLFVGNAESIHVKWFAEALGKYYPQIKIDVFNRGAKGSEDLAKSYNMVFNVKHHGAALLYRIPGVRGWIHGKDVERSFREFAVSCDKYDAVIFLEVPYWHKKTNKSIRRVAIKTAVFPFGSDLLRCNSKNEKAAIDFLAHVDVVATVTPSMKEVLLKRFKVVNTKLREWIMGNDFIDKYIESNLSMDIAKRRLNLDGHYVITCGYNGYAGQRHIEILTEILKIKNLLPHNYILMIPLGYGCNISYIEKVRHFCDENELNSIIYDSFLSNEEQLCTRYATDIFVHAQPTDNSSCSMHEFLLAGAKMVNGNWVRYPQLEKYEIPYFLYDSFNELGAVILKAIESSNPCTRATKELLTKTGRRKSLEDWAKFIMTK